MNENLRILGCSGGIGGSGVRTTSLLLDGHILLDAGTGVGDLSLDEMANVDHVFLTHAHLDHIAALPLMLDSVLGMAAKSLQVYAPSEVVLALRKHIFNWVIWPDFSVIPSPEFPCVVFMPFDVGAEFDFGRGVIRALPANHHVSAVAYEMCTAHGSTVYSGDTRACPMLLSALKAIPHLRTLIVECAFPNQEKELAARAAHFCPDTLAQWLDQFEIEQLCITHLKPQLADLTMLEVETLFAGRTSTKVVRLQQGAVLRV